jgi:hypothetical protein
VVNEEGGNDDEIGFPVDVVLFAVKLWDTEMAGHKTRRLDRRVAAIERRMVAHLEIMEIAVRGGLPGSDDDPRFATVGGIRWERAPAESLAAFRARAVAAATAAGERHIIIGGCPTMIR